MNYLRIGKGISICVVFLLSVWIFDTYCPLENIIGIPCPGCNMSTALYWLLIKQDIQTACFFHPVVILLVPYLSYAGIVWIKKDMEGWKKKSFRNISIVFLSVLVICYVYRMITVFPAWPMTYHEDALFMKVISLV